MDRFLDFFFSLLSHNWADVIWHKLEDEVPDEGGETNNKAEDPLFLCQTSNMHFHCERSMLNDKILTYHNNYPDEDKHQVCE